MYCKLADLRKNSKILLNNILYLVLNIERKKGIRGYQYCCPKRDGTNKTYTQEINQLY